MDAFLSNVLHVLDRVHDLVNQFQSHTGDDTLSLCKGTLESTESNASFLSCHAGKELAKFRTKASVLKYRYVESTHRRNSRQYDGV